MCVAKFLKHFLTARSRHVTRCAGIRIMKIETVNLRFRANYLKNANLRLRTYTSLATNAWATKSQ